MPQQTAAKSFTAFRRYVVRKLKERSTENEFIKDMIRLAGYIDYEGPEIMELHTAYEEWDDQRVEYRDNVDDWWDDQGCSMIHDWIINEHAGLCPDEVVEEVKRILDF